MGDEIYPWVIILGGKVYYNFVGDALQFRPKGTNLKDLMNIINKVYIPTTKGNPNLLNYPELQLYVQFPEQAENVGLNPSHYTNLVNKNRNLIKEITPPKEAPKKRYAKQYVSKD